MSDQETQKTTLLQASDASKITEASKEMNPEEKASDSRSRRRGLVLPPKGQALSRLQDLEDSMPPTLKDETIQNGMTTDEGSNAVNTASSNAVRQESMEAEREAADYKDAASVSVQKPALSPVSRPVREPTTRITVDMPDSLHRRISFLSVETRRSIKELVIEALDMTYFQSASAREKE